MRLQQWLHRLSNRSRRNLEGKRLVARRRFGCEALEGRALMASGIRPLDGVGNNLSNPSWGATDANLLRLSPAEYADGVSSPGGEARPSARLVSNVLSSHPEEPVLNDRGLSNFVYAWGQFIDHDLDLTDTAKPRSAFNISVPTGDPEFDPASTGTQVIPLSRSEFDSTTGTSTSNPRQQINSVTAYLDGSMVYGSDPTRAAALRTFSGGKLKTSAGNLLPMNTEGLENANDTHQTPNDQLFLAGDVRANENIELTSLQTLFVREHNRIADQVSKSHRAWTDEQIYQEARKIVIGEIQAITYNEFLPALLGPSAMRPSRGYNAQVNPGISNEFSTAAFRFGHSMLGDDVEFLDNNGNETQDPLELKDAFFNPNALKASGIDPLLKYLASAQAEEIDPLVVDSLRNFLFGQPGQGGLDLPSLNIQRGRDHGLADYNTTRVAFGFPRATSFADITSDPDVQSKLAAVYRSVDDVDLWVGGLAEDHVPDGSLGPLFTRIIADQFMRLRDGDRFFYQWQFQGAQLKDIQRTSLADVIKRNSGVSNVQDNVFVFKTAIQGTVFGDANIDGRFNPRERGQSGRTVQLLDANGTVVATTTTDARGQYRFKDPGLGAFRVSPVVPAGVRLTTPATRSVVITRGMMVDRQDFGEAVSGQRPPVTPGNVFVPRQGFVDAINAPQHSLPTMRSAPPFRGRALTRFPRA